MSPAAGRPAVRLLHTSDLHLGESATAEGVARDEAALAAVVDVALAHAVDLVVLVGDVFDSNRVGPAARAALADHLGRLASPVVVLPGNHDPLVAGSVWDRVELPAHVHVLREPAGESLALPDLGVEVWGRPHTSWDDCSPLDDLPPRGPLPWQVALVHGHLVRGPGDARHAYLLTAEDLAASARDYVALGHWDVTRDVSVEGVAAWYSGSPTRVGSCVLVTMAEGEGGPEVRVDALRLDHRPT